MQRLRLLLGTLAAALIVALLAGMFVLQTRGTHNQVNTGHGNGPAAPGACTPANITAHPPANTFLADLDMISPTEGWAVGYIRDAQNYGPVNTLIMRYHNCSWAPVATNYPNATLLSVSMVSATEGWAVGGTGDGHPLALHYTGGKWRQTRLPGEDGLSGVYSAIHIRSADEGWLVVQHAKDARGELSESLLHLVGGRWSTVKAPFAMFNDVLPVAPNEAWMAGYVADGQQQPVLYHYHGGSWTSVTLPRGVVVDRLRMVSPNDIWASGHINAPSNVDYQATAAALHFDGSGWRVVNSGASGHPQFVQAFDANTSLAFTLSQASAHEQLDVIGAVQYERGGKWMTVAWPFQNMGLGFVALGLNPIQRVSGDEYWTIGWIQPSNGAAQPVLLYFTSGVWHAYGAN